jgi:3' terminal RNA ribose 2'-O-methyltransferase Hen1
MLLTLTTTHRPATDLGYLLHKNPDRLHSFDLSFGVARVFFPEASPERCVAALLLELDQIGLVQGKGRRGSSRKYDYVSDRPYVASSFLSVAISRVFASAMAGTSRERQDLVATPIELEAALDVVKVRGGEDFLRGVFEPLGYEVTVGQLSPRYLSFSLRRVCTLQELLGHLYVLIPVVDDDKHYWIGDDEVDKLLRRGGDWLAGHPMRDQIVDRYLKHRAPLRRAALAQLLEAEDEAGDEEPEERGQGEAVLEERVGLNTQRLQAVVRVLKQRKARCVLDLGCGEGRLIALLLKEREIDEIVGLEVSSAVLDIARRRLRVDEMPERQAARLKLIQGSLTYRDRRLVGYDAAAVLEVIEHLEPGRLSAFESVVFGQARPPCVVITTPNADYNQRFPNLPAGKFRHPDHRFEWSRAEFQRVAPRDVDGAVRRRAVCPGQPRREAHARAPGQECAADARPRRIAAADGR